MAVILPEYIVSPVAINYLYTYGNGSLTANPILYVNNL